MRRLPPCDVETPLFIAVNIFDPSDVMHEKVGIPFGEKTTWDQFGNCHIVEPEQYIGAYFKESDIREDAPEVCAGIAIVETRMVKLIEKAMEYGYQGIRLSEKGYSPIWIRFAKGAQP
jgi:hypothetical protein